MTRWLVTGAGGMLGRDLVEVLRELLPEVELATTDRSTLDITDAAAVARAVAGQRIVVNAAGWTDVDGAEAAEAAATAVNGHAVAGLARACREAGARLIHISTDYVFNGEAEHPYPEDAPTDPVNAYGRSKLVGERAVRQLLPRDGYVVRTAWLYATHGRNFVTTMLRLATERDTLPVVADQRGQPTWTRELARQIAALGVRATTRGTPAGIYHGTASGETSWYGLARAVLGAAGLDPSRVRPVTSEMFPRPAPRPAYSVLGHDRWPAAGVALQPAWHSQLTAALADLAAASHRSGRSAGPPAGSRAPGTER